MVGTDGQKMHVFDSSGHFYEKRGVRLGANRLARLLTMLIMCCFFQPFWRK